jgi:hypothetical protein
MNQSSFYHAFNAREDLKTMYGDNALLLYALQLRFDIEDIVAVASEALTDGHNDKKCDLIYVDRESGVAVVAQAYNRNNPKDEDLAPANKASDLNTAAAWILNDDREVIPKQIKEAVIDLQEALKAGEITSLYFWYVHNLNEKNNPDVQTEMNTLQVSAQRLVDSFCHEFPVKVIAIEVGNNTIEKWYATSSRRITVEDDFEVSINGGGFEIRGEKWKAFVTAVNGKWLRKLYIEKGDDLFSGNPRNFLGAGKRKNNINHGIINTVESDANNFWAYNNGITALVNNYEPEVDNNILTIHGITIINGAQTTGAIGAAKDISEDFYVPSRFIVCNDPTVISEIINNNNKQNEILPADLRSNDKQQERLRREFKKYPSLYYSGGRRDSNVIKNREVFDPYLVAQTLLAFHGDCVTAYNGKKTIWDEDREYNSVFTDQLTAEHIIFVYALSRAIDEYKISLKNKKELRTEIEEQQMAFLSKRGSKMLLIYAISATLENMLGEKIVDAWNLKFKDATDFARLVELWKLVISVVISFCQNLLPALEGGLKNRETARTCVDTIRSLMSAIQGMLKVQLKVFADEVSIRI